jgi:hypothetical protein
MKVSALNGFFLCVLHQSTECWLKEIRTWDEASVLCEGTSPENICPRCRLLQWTDAEDWLPNRDLLAIYLHERICAGDEENEARDLLVRLLFDPLIQWLSGHFPRTDRGIIADGATDAILDYFRHPNRFHAEKGGMQAFLQCLAWRNVDDALRRDIRGKRRQKEAIDHLCCQATANGNIDANAEGFETRWQTNCKQMQRFLRTLNETDRRMMELWLNGERCSSQFSIVLDIGHLPAVEHKAIVNRVKKRLRMTAQRWIRSHI